MNNLKVLSKFSPIHEINLSEFDIFKHTSKISINENRKFNICIFSLSEKVSIIKLPVRKRIVKIKRKTNKFFFSLSTLLINLPFKLKLSEIIKRAKINK